MALLAVQSISRVGTVITPVAAAGGGDSFANTGNETFRCKNGGGAPINVTFTGQTPCDQGVTHNLVIAVAAGAEMGVKGLNPNRFNDGNRLTQVTYSGVTTVTVYVEG